MFYLFLAAHLVADFILQPLWLVQRKRRWDGLLIHTGLVLLCMFGLGLIEPVAWTLWPWMLLIAAIHFVADWWKVHHAGSMFRPPIVAFVLDQVVHIGTIALVLSLAMAPAAIWGLNSFAYARLALTLGVYIIAAFAVPIGLIVALDPAFHHAATAPMARARALISATGVLGLTIYGGPLALPLVLIGVALASVPLAQHPLDAPRGRLTVMSVAALLGAWVAVLY
jgi:hypothetical protein